MTVVLPTSLKYCCYTTLWNAEVVVWPFTATSSYWELWIAHAWAQKITVRQQNHCKSVTYLTLTYRTKISDIDELKRRIISEWAALSQKIDSAVREWRQHLYALTFVLEADSLSTCWNKDCVMWHIRQLTILRGNNCQSRSLLLS